MMTLSNVFSRTLEAYQSDDYSIISNKGGTRSGKTYSILQLLYLILVGKQSNLLISVVSRTFPHLKRGCIRDFEAILDSVERAGLVNIQKVDNIYVFQNNNRIEFFSADDIGKLHGAARDILYVNEANYIESEKISQLFVRTKGVKFIDYNPSAQFWIDDYRDRPDFIEFHSTYLDNNFLTKDQIRDIESRKKNERWWSIYGLGQDYATEGLCFPNVVFELNEPQWENPTWGLDFGWHDPTVLVKTEIQGDKLYVKQEFYNANMDITEIKQLLAQNCRKRKDLIVCDSAEPQIIHELHKDGWLVKNCIKGKNSIFDGIQTMNNYEIHYVGSPTCMTAKEFKTYSYEQDLDGNYTDRPEDKHNHGMDAARYAVTYSLNKPSGSYSYFFT